MDQIIILAAGYQIIAEITIFSMRYVGPQRALSAPNESLSAKIRHNAVIFMLIVSAPLSVILSLPVLFYVTETPNLELYLIYAMSSLLMILKETEVMFARSSLVVERALLLNTLYSVLNSVLVPLFYYITPTLKSVLWAWNIALLITVILGIKPLLLVLKLKIFDLKVIQNLLRFGFPIFIISVPRPVILNLNNLIIFENLEEGATSVFYWPNRILGIASEFLLIFLVGIEELFTHFNTTNKETLRDSFLAIFRLLVVFSTICYFLIYLNAGILIELLLGSGYLEAIYLFRLLCLAWIITTVNTVLSALKNAEAHRRVMVKVNIYNFTSKVLLLIILIPIGLLGVVIAEILTVTIVFIYFAMNINFFKVNDNFIRLGLFVASVMLLSVFGSFFDMTTLFSFIILNSLYLIITMIVFFLCSPFTNHDIDFAKKILPMRIQWVFRFYRPSKSIYDKSVIGNSY